MMECVAITKRWFDEIKDRVQYEDPYFYTDEIFGEMVEVDVNAEQFEAVSKELGRI